MSVNIKYPYTTYCKGNQLIDGLNHHIESSKEINIVLKQCFINPKIDDEGKNYTGVANFIIYSPYDDAPIPDVRIYELGHQATQLPSLVQVNDDGHIRYEDAMEVNGEIEINQHYPFDITTCELENFNQLHNYMVNQTIGANHNIHNYIARYTPDINLMQYCEINFNDLDASLAVTVNRLESKFHEKLERDNIEKIINRIDHLSTNGKREIIQYSTTAFKVQHQKLYDSWGC